MYKNIEVEKLDKLDKILAEINVDDLDWDQYDIEEVSEEDNVIGKADDLLIKIFFALLETKRKVGDMLENMDSLGINEKNYKKKIGGRHIVTQFLISNTTLEKLDTIFTEILKIEVAKFLFEGEPSEVLVSIKKGGYVVMNNPNQENQLISQQMLQTFFLDPYGSDPFFNSQF